MSNTPATHGISRAATAIILLSLIMFSGWVSAQRPVLVGPGTVPDISSGNFGAALPFISPNGRTVVYQSANDIIPYDVETGAKAGR